MTSTNTAMTPERIVGDLIDAAAPDGEQMLQVGQVAKVLGVTDRAVLYLLQDNRLGYIRTGKRGYRIPRPLLAEYLLQGFIPRQLTAAEQLLAETRQAVKEATDKLAALAARIAAAEATLALVDGTDAIPHRGRSTQTVP
ncbi:excisionase family DNA-binding protein [Nonomuraea cavernae]|uniref:Helix-turn-helix domain-containing protein n=1 Tax=Nonomuraea cavernae TaxID=2045107 RepID=A0A917YSL3_9ACTN|nr:excisionase family DNA-binding protein [Nonomuraea cavernae]MCA2184689.1 excisionase family DNA-binding protein [Nonomuraea cavernae]GGO63055.1 hypothetical protein GCM10012289_09080 [Nonomuraea cavernae]